MKTYKIVYFLSEKSNPSFIFELSKEGRDCGASVSFFSDGLKSWQCKIKNSMINGSDKNWDYNTEPFCFQNFKKSALQGIKISFI